MKTATIPSLRVDPKLRKAAEKVLRDGESLSSFVELSLRENIQRRENQREFIRRGLAAGEEARRTGKYVTASGVLRGLEQMLEKARVATKRR
jgi:predicted transcriptional regulator